MPDLPRTFIFLHCHLNPGQALCLTLPRTLPGSVICSQQQQHLGVGCLWGLYSAQALCFLPYQGRDRLSVSGVISGNCCRLLLSTGAQPFQNRSFHQSHIWNFHLPFLPFSDHPAPFFPDTLPNFSIHGFGVRPWVISVPRPHWGSNGQTIGCTA